MSRLRFDHGRVAAELFAGIGLVRLALENQGWDIVYANDIDPKKGALYRQNWPDNDHLHVGDVHAVDPDDVPTVDLLTASFPCNDLSIAGRWAGLSGRESSAFWGMTRLLDGMGRRKPPHVLIENVVGFLQSDGGRDLETALLALNQRGYAIDAYLLDARRWVPQSRPRLFLAADLEPAPDATRMAMTCPTRPAALTAFINRHPHVRWNLRPAPPLPDPSATLDALVEDLPDDDPHWWSEERAAYFMGQLSDRHAEAARRMIVGDRPTYATAFRRVRHGRSMAELRTDGIAGCLRTPRGGSGRQILFKAGLGRRQVRLLTARECARLQGVPDTYRIDVPLNQALFGFGDAVCVPAVEWVVQSCFGGNAVNREPDACLT